MAHASTGRFEWLSLPETNFPKEERRLGNCPIQHRFDFTAVRQRILGTALRYGERAGGRGKPQGAVEWLAFCQRSGQRTVEGIACGRRIHRLDLERRDRSHSSRIHPESALLSQRHHDIAHPSCKQIACSRFSTGLAGQRSHFRFVGSQDINQLEDRVRQRLGWTSTMVVMLVDPFGRPRLRLIGRRPFCGASPARSERPAWA